MLHISVTLSIIVNVAVGNNFAFTYIKGGGKGLFLSYRNFKSKFLVKKKQFGSDGFLRNPKLGFKTRFKKFEDFFHYMTVFPWANFYGGF